MYDRGRPAEKIIFTQADTAMQVGTQHKVFRGRCEGHTKEARDHRSPIDTFEGWVYFSHRLGTSL